MVIKLVLVGKKEESQKIQNRTCIHPTYLDKDTKDILILMRKTQTVKALVGINSRLTYSPAGLTGEEPGKIRSPPFSILLQTL